VGLRVATVTQLLAVPGLVHGFEQRGGPGPTETREQARLRVHAALKEAGTLLTLRQVHGSTLVRAPWQGTPEGDAATAHAPGHLLGIATADCLPILLVDPGRHAVAAVHAGWRGSAAGIARKAVAALVATGTTAGDLLAVIGPGIGPCCYEVGPEVRAAFGSEPDSVFLPGPGDRPRLDLRTVNARQLQEAGVREDRILHVDDCTACREDLYYSYRRDGPGTGRMISFIGFRA
jgi:YfiH family protein